MGIRGAAAGRGSLGSGVPMELCCQGLGRAEESPGAGVKPLSLEAGGHGLRWILRDPQRLGLVLLGAEQSLPFPLPPWAHPMAATAEGLSLVLSAQSLGQVVGCHVPGWMLVKAPAPPRQNWLLVLLVPNMQTWRPHCAQRDSASYGCAFLFPFFEL